MFELANYINIHLITLLINAGPILFLVSVWCLKHPLQSRNTNVMKNECMRK